MSSETFAPPQLAATIGCGGSSFHSMRHSYAVLSIAAGDDPKILQDNLGHHSSAFSLDRYAQIVPGMKERSAENMENLFQSLRR